MRKITAGLFITLDGVVDAPEKWNPPYYNDEMTQVVMGQMADADTQLYGRRTYELFRTVFTSPSAPPHAEMMTMRQRSSCPPPWSILTGAPRSSAVASPPDSPSSSSSPARTSALVGTGKHLFEGATSQVPLKLLESKPLSSGVLGCRFPLVIRRHRMCCVAVKPVTGLGHFFAEWAGVR